MAYIIIAAHQRRQAVLRDMYRRIEKEKPKTPEEELTNKLQLAFKSAVFLGYNAAADILKTTLAQAPAFSAQDPAVFLKNANLLITEAKWREGLEKRRQNLLEMEEKANKTVMGVHVHPFLYRKYKKALNDFNSQSLGVKRLAADKKNSFAADTAAAHALAEQLGKPDIAAAVSKARKASPVRLPDVGSEAPSAGHVPQRKRLVRENKNAP